MLSITINNEQKVKVTLTPVTDKGQPAKLDGVPTWTVLSGDSTVEVAEDGLSADLISADSSGTTEIEVKADAELGEGVVEIGETLTLIVTSATAKNLGATVGEPEAKA